MRMENRIPHLIRSLQTSTQFVDRYDAILIDEGQDFESEWLQLVSQLVNPQNELAIVS